MDITTPIILTVIGIIIGFLAGMLISSSRTGHEKHILPGPIADPVIDVELPSTSPSEEPSKGTDPTPSEPEGLIRIWYEAGKRQLVVEQNNLIFRSAEELSIEKLRSLVTTAKDFNNWLGLRSQPDPITQVTNEHNPVLEQPVAKPTVKTRTIQSPSTFVDEFQRTKNNPLKALIRAFEETNVAKIEPVTLTMAGQIDEILQKKLGNTPYENSGIRLVDTPNQGVVVMVGLGKYDGVESVPDEKIRALIREAVSEWEKLMLGK